MSESRVFLNKINNIIKDLQERYDITLSVGVKNIFKILVKEVIDRKGLFKTIEYHESDIFRSLDMIISEMKEEPSDIDLEISDAYRFRDMPRNVHPRSRGSKFLTSASFLSAISKKYCNIPPFCKRK